MSVKYVFFNNKDMSHIEIAYGFGYFLDSMVVRSLECAYRGAEYLRHLFVFHIVVVSHVEYQTLFVRQTCYSLLKFFLKLVTVEICVALNTVEQKGIITVIIDLSFHTLAVEEVDRLVNSYFEEPCRQPSVTSEIGQMIPGLDEGVLHEVIGIVMAYDHLAYLPVHLFAVGAHKQIEGLMSRFGVLQVFDEFRFVDGGLV